MRTDVVCAIVNALCYERRMCTLLKFGMLTMVCHIIHEMLGRILCLRLHCENNRVNLISSPIRISPDQSGTDSESDYLFHEIWIKNGPNRVVFIQI